LVWFGFEKVIRKPIRS